MRYVACGNARSKCVPHDVLRARARVVLRRCSGCCLSGRAAVITTVLFVLFNLHDDNDDDDDEDNDERDDVPPCVFPPHDPLQFS